MSMTRRIWLTVLFTALMVTLASPKFKFQKKSPARREHWSSSSSSSDDEQFQRQTSAPIKQSSPEPTPIQFSSGQTRPDDPAPAQALITEDECAYKPFYDYNVLVLIWPSEYCEETQDCDAAWSSNWDKATPLLRGYWPASGESSYYECFADSDSTGDPFCRHDAFGQSGQALAFLAEKIEEVRASGSRWYWFPKQGYRQYYSEEWMRHGSCYLSNMIEDNLRAYEFNPTAFNRTILSEYMRAGPDKATKLDIHLQSGQNFFSKEQFASQIGFDGREDHFNLICGDDNEVDEIHICYNRTRVPGKETTVECPHYDSCEKYPHFILP